MTRNSKTKEIKSLPSILNTFLGGKGYASFYTLFSDNKIKIGKKLISIFINNLLKDRELCYNIPNLSPLSLEKLEKLFEDLDSNKVKLDFSNQCPINTIIDKIDSLNINKQKDFFNSFCSILNKNGKYNSLTLDKRIIKIFILKTLKDKELTNKLYENLNIDENTIELAKKKAGKSKDILFKGLDEKERRKRLLVKATIINRLPNLSIKEQRKFFLEIYCLISGDKSLLEKDKLDKEDFKKISSELNNFLGTKKTAIFSLFFLERNKIKTKGLINKIALKFSENKEIRDLCIKRFHLENDIIEIENKFNNNQDNIIRENATGYIKEPIVPKEKIDTSDFITKLKQKKESDNSKDNNKKLKTETESFIKDLIQYTKSLKNRDISLSFDDFDLDDDYKLDKDLFDYLKDGVRESKRWQHILQFISEKKLNKFLKNYLKIDTDNEKVILDIGVNERLSPDDIKKLEAQAINRKTSFDSRIDIKDFLPILQTEIKKRVLEKNPNSELENYEILQSHFTIMFNTRQNTYIYPEMFDDREKVFKNMLRKKNYGKRGKRKKIEKTRWDYIYDIMSKKELKQFLLNFLQNR